MSSIHVQDISLRFIKHFNKPNSLKESVIQYILNFGKPSYQEQDFWVLRDMSFDLQDGDRLGIIGVNGAGKSSLLKAITGIYQPTKGKVKIEGRISSLIELGAGFDPELTGRENIYLNCLISGFTKREIQKKEASIIEFSELKDFIDTPIKYYSSGMALRLGFSISTTINPEILIFDELFAAGDMNFIAKALERIHQMVRDAHIFITVSHDNKQIRALCNKILYLKDRRIAYFGDDVEYGINQYIKDSGLTNAQPTAAPKSLFETL